VGNKRKCRLIYKRKKNDFGIVSLFRTVKYRNPLKPVG
jgi:hypothetical protein